MAVSLVSAPADLCPVYGVALKYKLRSSRFPNLIPGESGIIITFIGTPSAGDIAAFPGLTTRDVIMKHGASTPLVIGTTVTIAGNVVYNGDHKILKVLSGTACVIDGANYGDNPGGTWTKKYTTLRIKVQVRIRGVDVGKPHSLPVNSLGFAVIDVAKILQEQMNMVVFQPGFTFGALQWGFTNSYADYSISAWEAFDTYDSNGLPVFTDDRGGAISSLRLVAVNASQPYVHDIANQPYKYDDMLRPFWGGVTAAFRFLTHIPRGEDIPIARGDYGRLEVLNAYAATCDYRVTVKTYSGDGALVGTHVTTLSIPGKSIFYFAHGAGPMFGDWFPLDVVRYTIQCTAVFESSSLDGETLTFRFDPNPCKGPMVRFFYENTMGAMDTISAEGDLLTTSQAESTITMQNVIEERVGGTVQATRTVRTRISEDVCTATTRYLEPAWQRYIAQELLKSSRVMINTENVRNFLQPVLIDGEVSFSFKGERRPVVITYSPANRTQRHRQ